jgi:mRNA interferase RelE/StbE
VGDYTITFARSARKELERFDGHVINRICPKIEALAKGPRPIGCHKLEGEKNLWRIRVGDCRVIYTIDDGEQRVDIVAVRHRSKAYE